MSSILTNSRNVNINNGIFNAITQTTTIASVPSTLEKLAAAAAHTALHNAPARTEATRCHPDTRSNVLNLLAVWARDISQIQPLFWLHGGAGAGKSAVMQTLAGRFVVEGLVLGCFFFSRNDPSRNNASVLAATMAYQLLQCFPSLEELLEAVISMDPLIFTRSIQHQFLHLLVNPLLRLVEERHLTRASQSPRIFLIDGLDECINRTEQRAIIQAIAGVNHVHHLPIKFLVASRIEVDISTAFKTYATNTGVLQSTSLSDDIDAQRDIRHFVEREFQTIRSEHPFRDMLAPDWPSDNQVSSLVHKSSSHFVYAATVMRYISSPRESPVHALDVVLGLARTRTENPFSELDSLYRHILLSAAHRDKVLDIIAICMFTQFGNSTQTLALLLGCLPQDIQIFLADVTALINIDSLNCDSVHLLHASLQDFLDGKLRCGPELYIEKGLRITNVLRQHYLAMSLFHQLPVCPIGFDDFMCINILANLPRLITDTAQAGGYVYEILERHRLREIYPLPQWWPERHILVNCSDIVVAIQQTIRDPRMVSDYTNQWLELQEEYLSRRLTRIAPAIGPLLSTAFIPMLNIMWEHPYNSGFVEPVEPFKLILDTEDGTRYKSNLSSVSMSHGAESILMCISTPAVSMTRDHQEQASFWAVRRRQLRPHGVDDPFVRGMASIPLFMSANQLKMPCRPWYAAPFCYTTKQPLRRLNLFRHGMHIAIVSLHRRYFGMTSFMNPATLCDALIWLLSRAGFSHRLICYSNASLPLWLYRFWPNHARRTRKALDKYRVRVTKQRIKSLSVLIAQGDRAALIEKTHMFDIDALD